MHSSSSSSWAACASGQAKEDNPRVTGMKRMIQSADFQHLVSYSLTGTGVQLCRPANTTHMDETQMGETARE